MTAPAPCISVDQLKIALEALDWSAVKSLLDQAGGPTVDAALVALALRRASSLVFEYPAPAREKKRDDLLKNLVTYLMNGGPGGAQGDVENSIETLRIAEAGYRQLVRALESTDASRLPPSVHVAAAMKRSIREAHALTSLLHDQASERGFITLLTRIEDDEGRSLDPDAGLEHIVTFASMTIQMEAFKGGWFESDGVIVVPVSDDPTEEELFQVGSTFLLATLWNRWRSTEQSARLLGGHLRFLANEERPPNAASELKKFIQHIGQPHGDLLHRVAAERLRDRLSQNYLEIVADPSTKQLLDQTKFNGYLPPHGFLSSEELCTLWAIGQALSYEIYDDQERPGGLRLVEWVRGYCVLKDLAQQAQPGDLVRTKAGWQHYLANYGLAAATAEQLLTRLTFCRSSRDLFDQPFVKRQDGMYVLFKGGFESMNIAMVVLSTIGNLGERFQKKGKSFERSVRKVFEDVGIQTYAFKTTCNGEEFEYDVVVPWGEYLFIFECKNRSLPNNNPVQMHYFDLENQSNVRQVKRLMKALDDHPNILRDKLPAVATQKKRVPVLLNCLPYSIPGGIDGVFFYDYSALYRFFTSGQIFARSIKIGEEPTELALGPRLWVGTEPTAEDLLTQIREPVQFSVVCKSLEHIESGFPLPPDWAVLSSDFRRVENQDFSEAQTALVRKPS